MVDDLLAAGRRALADWDWNEARRAFQAAIRKRESAEALEGLAIAATWLDDVSTAIQAREQAYREFRRRGDGEGAARAAAGIADNLLTFRGDAAVAAGWLARARVLLADHPESPWLAWVEMLEAYVSIAYDRDVQRGAALAAEAVAHSRRLGDTDTEALSVAFLGLVQMTMGNVREGSRFLDQAVASVVGGDVTDPELAAQVCCVLVTASVRVRDFDRLAQWSTYAMDLSRHWSNRAMFSYPRIEHAAALIWWGRWPEAEAELLDVIAEMESRPLMARLATLRLADLRRRQGRLEEAEALLERLHDEPARVGMGHRTEAVRGTVALERGLPDEAAELARRYLRAVPTDDLVERVDGLEVLAAASATLADTSAASAAARELAAIGDSVGTAPLLAAARMAAALAALADGQHGSAVGSLEEAIDLYERSAAPYEAARSRLALARTLLAVGKSKRAVDEARRAYGALHRLDAARDMAAAEHLVTAFGGHGTRVPAASVLTPRELEVLRYLASGRSNDEIAAALVLSVRTVERHISNIYGKIGASGRAARAVATAYAHRHGLASARALPYVSEATEMRAGTDGERLPAR